MKKLLTIVLTLVLSIGLVTINNDSVAALDYSHCLKFTALEDDSSVTLKYDSGSDLKYSTDGGINWTSCKVAQDSDGDTIALAHAGDSVIISGSNVKTSISYCFSMTGSIAASGDVTSLTNGIGGNATLSDNCYEYMFVLCDALTSIDGLKLPSTTLAKSCYYGMFMACTDLTSIPSNLLPATILADNCYAYMFSNCEGLISLPSNLLTATTLANNCYDAMFSYCINLTSLPSLPEATLADECYRYMFSNCTSIKLSETQTSEYNIPYKIGGINSANQPTEDMFAGTGGTWTGGTPEVGTTYYLYGTLPSTTELTSDSADTTCEAVIGPRWHWNDEKGVCELEGYSVINTATY